MHFSRSPPRHVFEKAVLRLATAPRQSTKTMVGIHSTNPPSGTPVGGKKAHRVHFPARTAPSPGSAAHSKGKNNPRFQGPTSNHPPNPASRDPRAEGRRRAPCQWNSAFPNRPAPCAGTSRCTAPTGLFETGLAIWRTPFVVRLAKW